MGTERSCIAAFVLAFLFCAVPFTCGAASDKDLPDFLSATYALIGKKPGSGHTYSGAVTIKPHGTTIAVTRCIGASRITGKGSIIPVTSDKIPNLKVKWREGKDEYEALYIINSDANNYARLSGPYVRLRDEAKPGWEFLYIDPDGSPDCK